ncbi:MAG TPA: hypothetical protein VNN09_02815 [Candidatus Competibacteraceae bacterium]|nr:hypothetical protein [Candidatus Competibacteraceae bacterium]
MVTTQSRLGPGRFQWNTAGWFGSQLGSTVWLLGAALTMLPEHTEAGIVAFFCFFIPNIFGLMLYLRRNRIAPYAAFQWSILMTGIVSTLFVVYLNHSSLVGEIDPRLDYRQWGFYLLPILFGGLMVLFYFMERNALKKQNETPFQE